MEISKFMNGDKKAIIQREDCNYTVYYYLNNKIVSKEVVTDFGSAESMAEDYILEGKDDGPSLLNENV